MAIEVGWVLGGGGGGDSPLTLSWPEQKYLAIIKRIRNKANRIEQRIETENQSVDSSQFLDTLDSGGIRGGKFD